MARPKPNVLLEHVEQTTYKAEQILEAEAIYAVYYEGVAINLRLINKLVNYPGPKYKRCTFSAPGHALNLAERLNKQFKTTKFEVYKLTQGELVTNSY